MGLPALASGEPLPLRRGPRRPAAPGLFVCLRTSLAAASSHFKAVQTPCSVVTSAIYQRRKRRAHLKVLRAPCGQGTLVRGERQALAVVTARLAAIGSEQEEDASRQERGQAPHREVSKRLHEERV